MWPNDRRQMSRRSTDPPSEQKTLEWWFGKIGKLSLGWAVGLVILAGGGVWAQWQSAQTFRVTTESALAATKDAVAAQQRATDEQRVHNDQTQIQITELREQTAQLAQQSKDQSDRLHIIEQRVFK